MVCVGLSQKLFPGDKFLHFRTFSFVKDIYIRDIWENFLLVKDTYIREIAKVLFCVREICKSLDTFRSWIYEFLNSGEKDL